MATPPARWLATKAVTPALGLSVLLAIAACLVVFLLISTSASAAPTVTTDKAEYHPAETAVISGTGYTSGQSLDIVVIRPDLSIVTGDGTGTLGFDTRTATSGAFTYDYILNGIFGLYTVNVYDNADNLHTTVLASTTFLDDAGPVECNGGPTDTSQPGSEYVIDGSSTPPVPSGEVVTSICIKSGSDTFDPGSCVPTTCTTSHSGLVTVDGTYGIGSCYTVSGIGTDTVTITRGTSPPCNDISHLDFFTNDPDPGSTLKIVKDVSPDDPTTNWNIDVGGPTPFSDVLSGDDMTAVTPVDPGTYTITETAGANTDLNNYVSSFSCTGASPNPSGLGTVIIVEVDSGEDVVCTFENTDPRLKIIKDVVPDDATTNWNFEVSGPTPFSETIAGDGMTADTIVDPGTYTITETAGANTDLNDYDTTVSCTGASPNPPLGTAEINVTIDLGEAVVCTFTNSLIQRPGPPAVGGIAGLLEVDDRATTSEFGSDHTPIVVALAVLAGATLIAGGWYAQRRWVR